MGAAPSLASVMMDRSGKWTLSARLDQSGAGTSCPRFQGHNVTRSLQRSRANPMMTVAETAARLKMSTGHIRRLIAAGVIQSTTVPGGGKYGYSRRCYPSSVESYRLNKRPRGRPRREQLGLDTVIEVDQAPAQRCGECGRLKHFTDASGVCPDCRAGQRDSGTGQRDI